MMTLCWVERELKGGWITYGILIISITIKFYMKWHPPTPLKDRLLQRLTEDAQSGWHEAHSQPMPVDMLTSFIIWNQLWPLCVCVYIYIRVYIYIYICVSSLDFVLIFPWTQPLIHSSIMIQLNEIFHLNGGNALRKFHSSLNCKSICNGFGSEGQRYSKTVSCSHANTPWHSSRADFPCHVGTKVAPASWVEFFIAANCTPWSTRNMISPFHFN